MQVYIASTFGRNWPGAKLIFSGFFVQMGMGLAVCNFCIMWSKYLYSSYSRGVLILQQGNGQQHCNSKETNQPHFGKWKVRSIFVPFPWFSFQTFLRETNKQTKTLKYIPNPSGFGCQQKITITSTSRTTNIRLSTYFYSWTSISYAMLWSTMKLIIIIFTTASSFIFWNFNLSTLCGCSFESLNDSLMVF